MKLLIVFMLEDWNYKYYFLLCTYMEFPKFIWLILEKMLNEKNISKFNKN